MADELKFQLSVACRWIADGFSNIKMKFLLGSSIISLVSSTTIYSIFNGQTCDTAPVAITWLNSTCTSNACVTQNGQTTNVECNTRAFKPNKFINVPYLLTESYADSQCTSLVTGSATIANGTCIPSNGPKQTSTKTIINADKSVSVLLYSTSNCTGNPQKTISYDQNRLAGSCQGNATFSLYTSNQFQISPLMGLSLVPLLVAMFV